MRAVANGVGPRKVYGGPADMQADAVASALKIFGVSFDDAAVSLELGGPENDSALEQVRISEDAAIEHDARVVDGFELASSDLTGKAVFVNGDEALEVITANRRPLEEVLGVDLIYVNATMRNVVMVQYKMLEAEGRGGRRIGVPTGQTVPERGRSNEEVRWQPVAGARRVPDQRRGVLFEVRQERCEVGTRSDRYPDGSLRTAGKDPASKGSRGGFRVSYDTLGGRYLRQESFLGLVRSGYIGAYSKRASAFTRIIEAILKDGKGMVAAFQAKRR